MQSACIRTHATDPEQWTDRQFYNRLEPADRQHWAWFWLTRTSEYQAAVSTTRPTRWAMGQLGEFRLDEQRFENVFVGGACSVPSDVSSENPYSKIVWLPRFDPSVLTAEADHSTDEPGAAFDLATFGTMSTVLKDHTRREIVLFSQGQYHLQMFIDRGTVLQGPTKLRFLIDQVNHLDAVTASLARFNTLLQKRAFLPRQFQTSSSAGKWSRALQALDGFNAGASQREIAAALFGHQMVQREWHGQSDFLRTRTQRLIAFGRKMAAGAYRSLLQE